MIVKMETTFIFKKSILNNLVEFTLQLNFRP